MLLRSKTQAKPTEEKRLGINQFYIDKIVNRRKNHAGQYEYLAKWSGYSGSDNTWEPKANLPENMIQDYETSLRRAKDRKSRSKSRSKRDASEVEVTTSPPKQKRNRAEGSIGKSCSSFQGQSTTPEVEQAVDVEKSPELSLVMPVVDSLLTKTLNNSGQSNLAQTGVPAAAPEPWLQEIMAHPVQIVSGGLDNFNPELFNFGDLITFPTLEELMDDYDDYYWARSNENALGEANNEGVLNTPPHPFPETFTPLAVFRMETHK